jgi:hypothetical protein
MKIKAVYLKAGELEEPKVVEIEQDDLNALYKLIECDAIDIVQRRFGGFRYCVILDDCGRLKEKQIPSAVDWIKRELCLVGNLIVTGLPDSEGNLTSLHDADIRRIKKSALPFYHRSLNKTFYVFDVR